MATQANSNNGIESLDEPHRSIATHIRDKVSHDDIVKYVKWCKRDGKHYATKTETVAKKVASDVADELGTEDFEFNKDPNRGYHKGCAHIQTQVSLKLEEDDRVEYVSYGSKGDWRYIPDELADKREEAREEARAKFQRAMTSLHEGAAGLEEMGATVDTDGELYSGTNDRAVNVVFDDSGRGYRLSVSVSDDASTVYVNYQTLRKRDGRWKWSHSTDAFTHKPALEKFAAAIVEMEKHHERMERLSG